MLLIEVFFPPFTAGFLPRHLHSLLFSFLAQLLCIHLLQSLYLQRAVLLWALRAQHAVMEGICWYIPQNPQGDVLTLRIYVGGYALLLCFAFIIKLLKTITTI